MSDITIKDIARKCGVGVSTVSRAINNHPDINPQTREKILGVIQETGFVPNNSARYLKRTESNDIALIVKGITNPFFTDMIRVIEEGAAEHGYVAAIRHVESAQDEVAVAQALVKERRLKGIIFLGGRFLHEEDALEQIGVPFVFAAIGEDPKDVGTAERERLTRKLCCANIAVDDVQAAYDAVDYLIGLGHTKIGLISEGLCVPSVGHLRLRGYRRALADHGLAYCEDLVCDVRGDIEPFSLQNGYAAAKTLLERHPDLTAIFCISDVLAIGACRAVSDMGRKVPGDVSVIGFDGLEMGEYSNPRLTTMRQPLEEIAQQAVRILFGMIDQKSDPQDLIMQTRLLVRESTGPAPEKNA